jgi:hypothetical protein
LETFKRSKKRERERAWSEMREFVPFKMQNKSLKKSLRFRSNEFVVFMTDRETDKKD